MMPEELVVAPAHGETRQNKSSVPDTFKRAPDKRLNVKMGYSHWSLTKGYFKGKKKLQLILTSFFLF